MKFESRYEDRKEFANVLASTRYHAGLSQEYMAAELGVSRKTVQNWEAGTSFPDVFKFREWFEVTGVNPTPFFLQYFNADSMKGLTFTDSDERIRSALHDCLNDMTPDMCRELLFLLFGNHGSDPYSVFQLVTAHLHLPIINRVAIARQIAETYEMCALREELVCTDQEMPNLDNLNQAIVMGKNAAIKNKSGYFISN